MLRTYFAWPVLCAMALSSYGQTVSTEILGLVTDPSGANNREMQFALKYRF